MLSISGLEDIDVVKGSSTWLCRKSRDSCAEIHGESGLEGTTFPKIAKEALKKNCYLHMFEKISAEPRKVTLVCTGALTNAAILLRAFPEVQQSIEKVVLMGGSIGIGNMSPAAEWNILCDPEAAHVVFTSALKVIMIPIEVTHTVLCTPQVLLRIESINSKFSRLILDLLTFFKETYFKVFRFADPPLHDPCAIAFLIRPELFELQFLHVDIESRSQFSDGRTLCDIFGVTGKEKNVFVATSVRAQEFWELMLSALEKADRVSSLNS